MVEHSMQVIIQSMVSKGLRITDQRRSLALLFTQAKGYLTAKDVYGYMETKHSGLSFDTVYRNLRLMQEIGVLEQFQFEEGVKFRLGCFSHGHHHHHHLICLSCDQIYPLDFCPMNHVSDIPNQFKVVKHKFEIFGYCQTCVEVGIQ